LKIALPQYVQPNLSSDELGYVDEFIRLAVDEGAGLICFGEWFLGVEPLDYGSVVTKLRGLAAEARIAMVTGNIPCLVRGKLAQGSLVISPEGSIALEQRKLIPYRMEAANFLAGEELVAAKLPFGTLVVLNGLDAISHSFLPPMKLLRPNFLVMQMNPSSALEAEALKELALARSSGDCQVAVLPSLFDPYGGDFQGGGFVACEGEVIAEGMEGERLVIAEIDPDALLPYASLSEPVRIPELLRQKFLSETVVVSPG